MRTPPRCNKWTAFSILELLVVVAVIGLLAAFVVPDMSSLVQSRAVGDAAYELAGAAELARSEAIARRTYVWMGLQNTSSRETDPELAVGLVLSRDGTPNTARENLQPIGRVNRLPRLALAPPSAGSGSVRDLTAQDAGARIEIGGTAFSDVLLTFTPSGEIIASATPGPSDGFIPLSGIGLRTMRGAAADSNNLVDVVFDGSTGIAEIRRP